MTEKRTTTLINLWGGPGSGKSTLAAGVFSDFKQAGDSAELVREYVKDWCWRGTPIGPFDDIYITAKQLRAESALYGKVDYLITDSPIGLGAVFEQLYKPWSTTMQTLCDSIYSSQIQSGVHVVDLIVRRSATYDQAGRYEDEADARRVDELCREYLLQQGRRVETVNGIGRIVRLARAFRALRNSVVVR